MEQYQPCNLVTLRQLHKLEMRTQNIEVLTKLIPHIEAFKDMGGFTLNEEDTYYHYRCEHPVAVYISSWQFEENPMREPTWKNFLYILGEIGLKNLAIEIESFLEESKTLAITEEERLRTTSTSPTMSCEFCINDPCRMSHDSLRLLHSNQYHC